MPVDFEIDRLDEALARTSFNPQEPAFFSWLGVTYYLTKEAIRDTLARVQGIAAPGSRLALDYKIAHHLIPPEARPFTEKVEDFVERRGEPMVSTFTPEELNTEMGQAGFTELESVPPTEQMQRYLQGRSDMVEPPADFYFALFGIESPAAEGSA